MISSGCTPEPSRGAEEAGLEPPAASEGSGDAGRDSIREISPPLVLFVGTSLTEGLGLGDPAEEAWPARIEVRAREAGLLLRFRNAGLSGETSAGALRRLDWILQEAPALVVLETGANDGLRGLPVSQLEENLDRILSLLEERAPRARVVLAGMEAPPNLGPGYASAFREVYPRVAERWGAQLIPFLLDGIAGVPELNQMDRIHPTADGHNRMADVAWPILAPLLRETARVLDEGASP